MSNLSDLERRIAELERRIPSGGPALSSFGGGTQVRPVQVGFPVKTTSEFDATTGYSWERRAVGTGAVIDVPSFPVTGSYAFTPDNTTGLRVGTYGWLEPDGDARGWLLIAFGDDSGDSSCAGCDFLYDRDALISLSSGSTYPVNALQVKFLQGTGRCACFPEQGTDPLDPWLAEYDTAQSKWVLLRNGSTCCACFALTLSVPDPGDGTITGHMIVKESCDGITKDIGYDLKFAGCCMRDGGPVATLVGVGDDLCNSDAPYPCKNTFVVEVSCIDCATTNDPLCLDCLQTCGPPVLRVVGTFSGDHDVYNSAWYLTPVDGSPCKWSMTCPDPAIVGATTVTVVAEIVRVAGAAVLRVTFSGGPGGAVYEYTEGTYHDLPCYTEHTLTRVSGDAGKTPASIVVTPFNCEECPSKCSLIEYGSVVATVINSTGSCGTLSLTVSSATTGTVDFACVVGSFFSGVAHLTCTDVAGLAFAIDTASGPYTVSVTTVSLTFNPFMWVVDVVFTTISPPAPSPCSSVYRVVFSD